MHIYIYFVLFVGRNSCNENSVKANSDYRLGVIM